MLAILALVWVLANDSLYKISEPNMPAKTIRVDGFETYRNQPYLLMNSSLYRFHESTKTAERIAPGAHDLAQTKAYLYAVGFSDSYIWSDTEEKFVRLPGLRGHAKAFDSQLFVYHSNRLTILDDQTVTRVVDLDSDYGQIRDVAQINQRIYLLTYNFPEYSLLELKENSLEVVSHAVSRSNNSALAWNDMGLWFIDSQLDLYHIDRDGKPSVIAHNVSGSFLAPFNDGVIYTREENRQVTSYYATQTQDFLLHDGPIVDVCLTDHALIFQTANHIKSLTDSNQVISLVDVQAFAPRNQPSLHTYDAQQAYFWTAQGLLQSDGTQSGTSMILRRAIPIGYDYPSNSYQPKIFTNGATVYHTWGPNAIEEGLFRVEDSRSTIAYASPIKYHNFSPLILNNHFMNLTYVDNTVHLQITPLDGIDPEKVQMLSLETQRMLYTHLYEVNGQALIRRSTESGYDFLSFQPGSKTIASIPGLPHFEQQPSIRIGQNKAYLIQQEKAWVIRGNPLRAKEIAPSYYYDDSGYYLSYEVNYSQKYSADLIRKGPESDEILYTFHSEQSILRLDWYEATDALYILLSTDTQDHLYRAIAGQEPEELFTDFYGTPDYETRFFRFLPIEGVLYFTNNHALHKLENGEVITIQDWHSYGGPIFSFNEREAAYYILANDTAYKLEQDYLTTLDFDRPSYNDTQTWLGGYFNDSGDAYLVQNSYRSGFRDVTYIGADFEAKSIDLPYLSNWPSRLGPKLYFGDYNNDLGTYNLSSWDGITDGLTKIDATPYRTMYFHEFKDHLVINTQDQEGQVAYQLLNYVPKPRLHIASFGQVYMLQTESIRGASYQWKRNGEILSNPNNLPFYYLYGDPGDQIDLLVTLEDGRQFTNSATLPQNEPIPMKTFHLLPMGTRF